MLRIIKNQNEMTYTVDNLFGREGYSWMISEEYFNRHDTHMFRTNDESVNIRSKSTEWVIDNKNSLKRWLEDPYNRGIENSELTRKIALLISMENELQKRLQPKPEPKPKRKTIKGLEEELKPLIKELQKENANLRKRVEALELANIVKNKKELVKIFSGETLRWIKNANTVNRSSQSSSPQNLAQYVWNVHKKERKILLNT